MEWLALVTPPLIWAQARWASPFLKTHRHGMSASLSLLAGCLAFTSLRLDRPAFPILLVAAAVASAAMFVAMFWSPTRARTNRKDS